MSLRECRLRACTFHASVSVLLERFGELTLNEEAKGAEKGELLRVNIVGVRGISRWGCLNKL